VAVGALAVVVKPDHPRGGPQRVAAFEQAGAPGELTLPRATTSTTFPGSSASSAPSSSAAPGTQPTVGRAPSDRTASPSAAAGGAPSSTAVSIRPGPVQRSPLGTYGLRVDIDGSVSTGTYRVSPGPTADAELHRTDAAGAAAQEVRSFAFGAAASVASGGSAPSCTWSPPFLLLPAQVQPGTLWQADSSCDTQSGGQAVHQQRSMRAEVLGAARTTVQGRALDTWVIQRIEVDTERIGGVAVESQRTTSELFAPQLGMAVYAVSRTAIPNPDGSTFYTAEAIEITSLP
jgi:hypothetical protein